MNGEKEKNKTITDWGNTLPYILCVNTGADQRKNVSCFPRWTVIGVLEQTCVSQTDLVLWMLFYAIDLLLNVTYLMKVLVFSPPVLICYSRVMRRHLDIFLLFSSFWHSYLFSILKFQNGEYLFNFLTQIHCHHCQIHCHWHKGC